MTDNTTNAVERFGVYMAEGGWCSIIATAGGSYIRASAYDALAAKLEALRGDNEALTQALADERARTIAETQRADAAERKLAAERDRVKPWGQQ